MSSLERLKSCSDIYSFAELLGYQAKSLTYILYEIKPEQKYTIFTISKKSGGDRQIKAPIDRLKLAQKKLADLLYDCAKEISDNKKLPPLSHGFQKKLSTFTNAKLHKGSRYVFNLDLENFFPTINFGRVRGFFIKNNDFHLNPAVATWIAQLACHDNELPQGSPCSPIISNLVGHILDVRLVQLAKKYSCTYSRYADDLTFSTKLLSFPEQIACQKDAKTSEWQVGENLEKIITRSGFKINKTKTRMQYRESRQSVTGLIVNRHVNIRKEYYRNARAMCNALLRTGTFILPKTTEKGSFKQLEGILSHIHYVKHLSDYRSDEEKKKKPSGINKLYAQFLRYKCFYALEKPLIICEGKTDNIYLKCALKKLQAANPELISNPTSGIPQYKINLQNYVKKNGHPTKTSVLLQLFGGYGGLKILIEDYMRHFGHFRGPGLAHPVILLIDNDSGADKIYGVLQGLLNPKQKKGKNKAAPPANSVTIDGTKPFYHVFHNLYVVPTPKLAGKDSKIEDFFDDSLSRTQLGGKTFNAENTQSGDNGEYGKAIFADFVQKNQASVNFDGFQPILTNLTLAIQDYQSRLVAKASP
jgi:RNA-directed DNA polymerase